MKKIASYFFILTLLLTFVPFNTTNVYASPDEYDTLRAKWIDFLLGGNYDVNDPNISVKLSEISTEAQDFWGTMDKSQSRTYLWSDLADGETDGTPMGKSYSRLKTMALAYSMNGTTLNNNPALLNDIISALDWLYNNWYNENETEQGNWWWWEIGAASRLTDITAVLYSHLTSQQVANYMAAVNNFVADPTMMNYPSGGGYTSEAANRVDLCQNTIIEGIITKDSARIVTGRDALSDVFPYVTSGNGYYTDGSYVDHTNIPYTHSYGSVLISGLSKQMYLLADSTWDITDSQVNNVYNWVYDSYEPAIYKMQAFDSLRGRAISREKSTDLTTGKGLLGSIAMLAEAANAQDAAYFKSLIKYMVQENALYDSTDASIYNITNLNKIKNDPTITPRVELIKHVEFNNMDRSAHFAHDFAFAISKSSKRIGRYELINGENQKGWYTGDGMTNLYNDDYDAYSDDYWATVNYYRLPGTTVDTRTRSTGDYQYGDGEGTAANSWSGGVTIDEKYGASGMDLQAYGSTLIAKKSWFMFDDEVVALGSGITSTDNRTIETIVEQRKLSDLGDNTLTVNGVTKSSTLGWSETLTGTNWAHLSGNAASGADIGYYFPDASIIKGLRQEQPGTWYDVNMNSSTSTDTRTKNYMSLWFDHGKNPSNAAYSYVILPNKNPTQVESYANNPDITVIKNSTDVHCVKENNLNIVAANFWKNETHTADIITSNKMASVMTKEVSNSTIDVVVSDPTMENTGSILIEINKDASGGLISADNNITVLQTSPTIKFIVNTNGAKGKAFKATFNIDPSAPPVPVVWYSNSDFTAVYDLGSENDGAVTTEFDVTPLADGIDGVMGYADTSTTVSGYTDLAMIIRMNTSGYFDARNGSGYASLTAVPYHANTKYHVKMIADMFAKTYDVYVTPEGGSEVKIAENYHFRSDAPDTDDVGKLCLKDNGSTSELYKVENHSINAVVPVIHIVNPTADAFVRDGSYADENYGYNSYMTVKSDGTGYNRKAYAKFDFSAFNGVLAESAKVRLYVQSVNTDPSRTVKIYGTNDESWIESGITWNNAPSSSTYITSIDVTGIGWYEIDVTSYVNSSMDDKVVSFMFVNEGAVSSKGDFSFSTKEAGSNKPELVIK